MKEARRLSPRGGGRAAVLALACAALPLFGAAPALADSIVYAKDGNVWLANPDGSGQYQVTADGSPDHPYRSPSQADDGTIAAGFGDEIVRMRQNGEVLNRIDPPALLDSVSQPLDGPPIDVAISPDGSRIAYTMASYTCPVAAECGARTATAYTAADRLTPPQQGGTTYLRDPSWVTSSRTLQFGGYTHQVNVHDVGAASDAHWFDDWEVVGQPASTDLGDGELNPQGTMLALVRGYGPGATVVWYDVSGNAQTSLPPPPSMRCATGADAGISGPTWSPDGQSLAIADPEGIWVKRGAANCESPAPILAIPGGSQPDWGPAPVNPGPRAQQPGPLPAPSSGATSKPRPVGCAAKKGAAHDRCGYEAALKRCGKAPKARRARCIAAARRAYAISKCNRKHGKSRARCLRAVKRS
ncbi:MAG: PD40 domain-containing protein [Actinobacteria bacterium]|nr:PD40 domain-containing protein [Actinomycetota bacterium]